MEINVMEESIEKVTGEEMVIAVRAVKPGKASGPFGVCTEIVSAGAEVGISVIMELCQRMLEEEVVLDKWQTSVLVPIFEGKSDVSSCNACRAVKLLQLGDHCKSVWKKDGDLVNADAVRFCFTRGRGTTDALFVVRRMHEEYRDKCGKFCVLGVCREGI